MSDRWVSLEDAARALGVSGDAVRKRIERGALTGEKRNGKWAVLLPEAEARPEPVQSPPDQSELVGSLKDEIAHLRGEIAWTREELAQRSRELAQERERFDVIHREALARVEELLSLGALPERLSEPERDQEGEPRVSSPAEEERASAAPERPWWRWW